MTHRVIIEGVRKDPSLYGVYTFSVALQSGVVAANNFLSLFNPSGSGKFLVVGGLFLSSYGIGSTTAPEPMRGYRTTAASAGTLANNSTDVVKYDTSYLTPIAEVRTLNPTVTLGSPFFSSPPPLGTGGIGTQFVHSMEPPPGSGGFILRPGEGIVTRTAAGDIDQYWNITCVWGEGPSNA